MPEQRTVYRGEPSRAWIRLQIASPSGLVRDLNLVVDTGNPCAIIIDVETLKSMLWRESLQIDSNFGSLAGGWLRVMIPNLEYDQKLMCQGNDSIVSLVKRSDLVFDGLVGLPFLRTMQYGGNEGYFWIRASDTSADSC